MVRALAIADGLIKDLGRPRLGGLADRDWRPLALLILAAGPLYGAFMGSFALDSAERLLMVLYAAAKVPVLILATTLVCLPAFFALNTVLGLRGDFGPAIRAVLAGQAALTVALASLGPLTALAYVSGVNHRWALLFNAGMFSIATLIGHAIMRRRYRPLIASSGRHRLMLWVWVVLYAFVGVQMGWMLRPFVGTPGMAVSFFRAEPFTNAYVEIIRLVTGH